MFNKDTGFKINITITIEPMPAPRPSPAATPRVQRVELDSSVIKSVAYNPVTLELDIEFHTERTYRYSHVPSWRYEELIEARSAGQYFGRYIRDQYTTHEITA